MCVCVCVYVPQYIKLKFVLLQLTPISSLPFDGHHGKESSSIFSPIPIGS